MSKALVNSTLTNAVRLTLEYRTEEGLVGFDHVEIAPGQTEVDPKFWEAWLDQNKSWPPVASGAISGMVYDDEEPTDDRVEADKTVLDAPLPSLNETGSGQKESEKPPEPQGDAEPLPVATPTTTLEAGKETDPRQADSIQTEDAK